MTHWIGDDKPKRLKRPQKRGQPATKAVSGGPYTLPARNSRSIKTLTTMP